MNPLSVELAMRRSRFESSPTKSVRNAIVLHTRMLEVEPEIAFEIQARARARGVSVDEYLLKLMDRSAKNSERKKRPSSQEQVRLLREWASGHRQNLPSFDAIDCQPM